MQSFSRAIVRGVPTSFADAITTSKLGAPDYYAACRQHERYVEALEQCGVEVTMLEADTHYPDSVFIEDTAIVTDRCAIVTRPGAASRRGEIESVGAALRAMYDDIEYIESPGTVDGGDVLQVGDRFYIGVSQRTNRTGGEQLAQLLQRYGFETLFVNLNEFLHLKTGVAYLGANHLLVTGELVANECFQDFDKMIVPPDEAYCANAIRVNECVLIAKGFAATRDVISQHGHRVIELDMPEFEKADGGLSCLSLRLP